MKILLAFAVLLGVANIDARFTIPTFPITLNSFWSNLLPFTFNISSDSSDRGSITLTVKPRNRREVDTINVFKRDVSENNLGDLERESRLYNLSGLHSTSRWVLWPYAGPAVALGGVGAVAATVWALIAANLKYKKGYDGSDKHPWKIFPPPADQTDYAMPPPPPQPSYQSSYNSYMPPAPAYPAPAPPSRQKAPFSKYVTTKAMEEFYSKHRPPIRSPLDSFKDFQDLTKDLGDGLKGGMKGIRDLISVPNMIGKIPGLDMFKDLQKIWQKGGKRGKNKNQGNYYPYYPPALPSTDYAPQSSYRVPLQPDYSQSNSMYAPPPPPPYTPPVPDTSYDVYTPAVPTVAPIPPVAPPAQYNPLVAQTAAPPPPPIPAYLAPTAPPAPYVPPVPVQTNAPSTQAPATRAPPVWIFTTPPQNPIPNIQPANMVVFGVPPPTAASVSATMPAPVPWNTAPSGPWSAPDPMPFRPSMPFPSRWESSDSASWPLPLFARNAAPQAGTTAPATDASTLAPTDATATTAPSQVITTDQPVPTSVASVSASSSATIKSRRSS